MMGETAQPWVSALVRPEPGELAPAVYEAPVAEARMAAIAADEVPAARRPAAVGPVQAAG
jgi:hypothetical protein